MSDTHPWYIIHDIDRIDSPALVVYPERIRENIELMIRIAGSPSALRPHVKTYKMREVVQMQLDAGIDKFKCATIAEAEMVAGTGARDVMLAYQPVGPKVQRLLELALKFPAVRFSTLVDNRESAAAIAAAFRQAGRAIDVFLDLDVGMHRTGIAPDERAWELYLACLDLKGVRPVGLHVYDGHVRDSDLAERTRRCDEAFLLARALADRIAAHSGAEPEIVAGGSPTFPVHARREGVQCSPGTCLLWDWGYAEMLPEQDFRIAALVIARIISRVEDNLVCVDLGHKSVASESPFPRVHFLNLPDARPVSHSEEHLVLDVGDNRHLEVGAALYGVPVHICPTCALYERAVVVEDGRIAGEWRVAARDRKLTV